MTHISDRLRVGKLFDRRYQGANADAATANGGPGALTSPLYTYDIVPLTKQTNNIAAAQAVSGAGNLTLTAGTGTTSVSLNGSTVIKLDCARALQTVSSDAGDTTQTLLVSGYDDYGQPMSELFSYNGTTVISGKKAFRYIKMAAVSAALTGNASLGTLDVLGLPYAALSANYVVAVKWKGVLAQDAGTFVAADATSPATTTTGDVRATYTPSDSADGSKRLTVTLYVADPDSAVGLFGVTQA